jgi:vacuolar-type H+-ATPase subunit E/Vma4
MTLAVAGCGGIRLYDPGRLQVATEAVTLATQVGTGSGDVFAPMEQNVQAVQSTQERLRQLTDAHELETFQVILPRLTAGSISTRLAKAMDKRNDVFAALKVEEKEANEAINDALNRQTIIAAVLKDTAQGGDTAATLKRLNGRLDWLAGVGQAFDKLNEGLASTPKPGSGVAGAAIDASSANDKEALDKAVDAAKTSLKNVDKSPTVTASTLLLQRTAEQVISAEQSRLLVMREHLAGLERLRDSLVVRDRIDVCNLFLTAAGQVYAALDEKGKTALDAVFQKLKDSKRYECLGTLDLKQSPDITLLWSGGTLADYVAADIAAHKQGAKSPELVGALGILLFHERRLFADAELNLARERHLYSIRLSRVNAQQRAGLVHQLSASLEIYYQGGVKPETVAQLILAAAQVGALTFIGVQQ